MLVLCVGGPLDGKHVAIETVLPTIYVSQRSSISLRPYWEIDDEAPTLWLSRAAYDAYRLHPGDDSRPPLWVYVEKSMTAWDTVAALLDKYSEGGKVVS